MSDLTVMSERLPSCSIIAICCVSPYVAVWLNFILLVIGVLHPGALFKLMIAANDPATLNLDPLDLEA